MTNNPHIYYWSGNPKGTHALVQKVGIPHTTITHNTPPPQQPYILITPTYGSPVTGGYIPKPVDKFLTQYHNLCVGTIGTGNLNFGADYCKAVHIIKDTYQIPILYRCELRGTEQDVTAIKNGVTQNWDTLLKMKGVQTNVGP